jgi:hypothetical protein
MTEFDNDFTLSALAGLDDASLIGMGAPAIRKMIKRAAAPRLLVNNSRASFISKQTQFHPTIQKGLETARLQGVDTAFLMIKSISQVSAIKMLQDSDTKSAGFCMINNSKLEKDEEFVLHAIQVLYGVHASAVMTTAAVAAAGVWGTLPDSISFGQFELKVENKTLIPDHSMRVFKKSQNVALTTSGATHLTETAGIGYWELANPKLIPSQVSIEFNVEWGLAAAQYAGLAVILHGTRAYKN